MASWVFIHTIVGMARCKKSIIFIVKGVYEFIIMGMATGVFRTINMGMSTGSI
jgi:hypothetical protein